MPPGNEWRGSGASLGCCMPSGWVTARTRHPSHQPTFCSCTTLLSSLSLSSLSSLEPLRAATTPSHLPTQYHAAAPTPDTSPHPRQRPTAGQSLIVPPSYLPTTLVVLSDKTSLRSLALLQHPARSLAARLLLSCVQETRPRTRTHTKHSLAHPTLVRHTHPPTTTSNTSLTTPPRLPLQQCASPPPPCSSSPSPWRHSRQHPTGATTTAASSTSPSRSRVMAT